MTATNLAHFVACAHIATLDGLEAAGELRRPYRPAPAAEILARRGAEHELAHLDILRATHGAIAEISGSWDAAVDATKRAMQEGVAAVYQAALANAPWRGRPDFLVRVNRPSRIGDWSYEIADAKLARSAKPKALIQLCLYAELLATEQGLEPERVHLILGGGNGTESFRLSHFAAYYRRIKRSFLDSDAQLNKDTYPEPVDQCVVCDWYSICDQRWHEDDALCLVPGITRNQRKALTARTVMTVSALGTLALPMTPPLDRVSSVALQRIREQARIQLAGRIAGQLVHELITDVEPNRGLAALPEPSDGDLFLDIEGDPYVGDIGIEYLFGLVDGRGGEPSYVCWWGLNRVDEQRAFEAVLDFIADRWRTCPGMHVFHYNHYEPTALKRLAGRFNTRVDVLDDLLRAGVFVDLYRVERQGLIASVESYSIKRLEPLFGFSRTTDLRDANRCLQAIETWLHLGTTDLDDAVKDRVEAYNRDDCLAAFALRGWLEEQRNDLAARLGAPIARPAPSSSSLSEEFTKRQAEVRDLMDRLLRAVPDDRSTWTASDEARWLIAQLLEWHRREDKSAWWEYFRLCDLTDEELQEEKSSLGGLEYEGEVGRVKRSAVHRYRFPAQEHAFDVGDTPHDPATQKPAGTIVSLDEISGALELKRSLKSQAPHPRALVAVDNVSTAAMRDSLLGLGRSIVTDGLEACPLAANILTRARPRIQGTPADEPLTLAGENPVDAVIRIAPALDGSVLAIQGPPGSGKTYTGARMIVELVRRSAKVGIIANSHKVISNLLKEVCEAARKGCVQLHAIQKVSDLDSEGTADPLVTVTDDNGTVLAALTGGQAAVAAGTSWMWARPEFRDAVDVLFADEAGQMSLANVVAVTPSTRNIVLLGDPQQLDQPQKGVHPPGSEASALGHLLAGMPTIGPDQGLFLGETWRLHPDLCTFISEAFYEGRLHPHPDNARQCVEGDGPLCGTGLRFVPVPHDGNQNESVEETEVVAWLIEEVLRGHPAWIDRTGTRNHLTLDDMLIVAPYNAHVAALRARLPPGARVGTVDKFQGQQAPIVIYSMATSTPEDAPRGMEFLYRPNRLNVAMSRAKCVAALVASPALFDVQCRTPHQMRLANALCRLLELASTVVPPHHSTRQQPTAN